MKMARVMMAMVAVSMLAMACGDGSLELSEDDLVVQEAEVRGVPSRFDRDDIMTDALFNGDVYGLTVEQVQAFFEDTPYGRRSWLASERVGGKTAAEALVDAAAKYEVEPLVLLVRMQAEMSLISATSRPSTRRRDFAFGCGCYDNQACQEQWRGLDKQLECASRYLRENYVRSEQSQGSYYTVGETKRTLDRYYVTPENHATAAHYNYTPWAGSSSRHTGAWLTWVILRKFAAHATTLEGVELPRDSFIGATCEDASGCGFSASGQSGECVLGQSAGICSVGCEGYCADKDGWAPTFCVSLDGGRTGQCVPKADTSNGSCSRLDGVEKLRLDRFVGSSIARSSSADVCVPVGAIELGGEEDPEAFVGASCAQDDSCNFAGNGGEVGECLPGDAGGICSLECEGFCPDKDGWAPTFCVSVDGGLTGQCVPRAHADNGYCSEIPGAIAVERARHVGSSGASRLTRTVCVPR